MRGLTARCGVTIGGNLTVGLPLVNYLDSMLFDADSDAAGAETISIAGYAIVEWDDPDGLDDFPDALAFADDPASPVLVDIDFSAGDSIEYQFEVDSGFLVARLSALEQSIQDPGDLVGLFNTTLT